MRDSAERFQTDPHWPDLILFYECFHGDNGAGLGASDQAGWTGLVAKLIELYGLLGPSVHCAWARRPRLLKVPQQQSAKAEMREPLYPLLYQINAARG
jgi:hypothetical protein